MSEEEVGFGDNPEKHIYGPTPTEASQLNSFAPKGESFLKKAAKHPLVRGITAAMGGIFSAGHQPMVEARDLSADSAYMSQQPTASPLVELALITQVQPEMVGFNEEETTILSNDYHRSIQILSDRYGSEYFNNLTIVFIRVEQKTVGHGTYTGYLYKQSKGDIKQVEMQVTEISPHALWEIHHQLAHLYLTKYLAIGQDEMPNFVGGKPTAQGMEGREWITRVSEGLAEVVAYQLQDDADQTLSALLKGQINDFLTYHESRQNPQLSQSRFDYARYRYSAAAAALLTLEQQFPGLLSNMVNIYHQTGEQNINPVTGQRFSKGYLAMVGELERLHPGFIEALSQETALYYGSPPATLITRS